MTEKLYLGSLEKAISQLSKGLEVANSDPQNDLYRDGVIQRFEYTMDLACKLIQRYLKIVAQIDDSSIRSKKDLFREAGRLKMIADIEAWIAHYEARNQTSHDYDAKKAALVYAQVKLFLPDVKKLLEVLLRDAC